MQVLAGPRQTGKTTLVRQVMEASKISSHYASADEPTLRDRTWLEQQWDLARLQARERKAGALLVLDEIQKVADWSSAVKLLWDADTHSGIPLKVVPLGSSPLLNQSGLTEILAGRFEVILVPHWSFMEMREAFGWNLEQYIFLRRLFGRSGADDDRPGSAIPGRGETRRELLGTAGRVLSRRTPGQFKFWKQYLCNLLA